MEHLWRPQYPRNIPARHPRSVLSEFGIGTRRRRIPRRRVRPPKRTLLSTHRKSRTPIRQRYEETIWKVKWYARGARDVSRLLHRETLDERSELLYGTASKISPGISSPWSGYLISQLRRLRSEFRNATTSDLNSSPWFDWKGEGKNRVLFYSSLESTRNIQIFDPNWIESSRKILLKIVDWVSRRLDERLDLFLFEKIRNEMKDIKR